MNNYDIGFDLAYHLAVENSRCMGSQTLSVALAAGRVLSAPVYAKVDSPSVDSSLKDGYAVLSSDFHNASTNSPVHLKIIGNASAGKPCDCKVRRGTAVRILTGAPLPEGADAVLAEEFAAIEKKTAINAFASIPPGRNIFSRGADVKSGERLADRGQALTPQLISLIVAGGISEVAVFKRPRIGLLAIGSEILLPGLPMAPGKLYASNIAFQEAWLQSTGFECQVSSVEDSEKLIFNAIRQMQAGSDVMLTSGGAWKSERDLVVKVLNSLGWNLLFHRVRMKPGKAMAMGILENKPVFCLPGGPASNEITFMMIALPAILKMAGHSHAPYISLTGKLEDDIKGEVGWTQFVQCDIIQQGPEIILRSQKLKSRLSAMSCAHAIVKIPEGVETLSAGETVPFICLSKNSFSSPLNADA